MISHPVLTICGGIAVKVCISYAGYRFLKRASNKDKYLKLFRKNYTQLSLYFLQVHQQSDPALDNIPVANEKNINRVYPKKSIGVTDNTQKGGKAESLQGVMSIFSFVLTPPGSLGFILIQLPKSIYYQQSRLFHFLAIQESRCRCHRRL